MLKRVNWKLVFKCFAWTLCLGGIITLMSFVEVKKNTVTCTNIKILIPGADNFIEREEIDAILKQSEGTLKGRNLERINLNAMEQRIIANPYIANSKVYADMDGVIHIEISQRQPLLRIINSNGQDYYIDRVGLKMPVSPNFTADVLVANGHILEHFGGKVDTLITKMAADLYRTALFLKKDTLWDSQIEQIFVNDKDDIELVPRVGNQRIILGSADSLEKKMNNLLIFYKKAMPQVGWDTYKTINIKYTNQIVCERNKIDSINGVPVKTATVAHSALKAKKVIDSLVNARIASELQNNPDDDEGADIAAAVPVKKTVIRVIPVVINNEPAKKKAVQEVKKEAVKHTETVTKAAKTKEPAKKESVKKDIVKKEPAMKEPVKKEPSKKEAVKDEKAKKDVSKSDAVKKDVAKKEPAKKDAVKKDAVKTTTVKEVTTKTAAPVKKEPVKPKETVKSAAVKEPAKSVTVKKVVVKEPVKLPEGQTPRKSWPPHAADKKDTKKNK